MMLNGTVVKKVQTPLSTASLRLVSPQASLIMAGTSHRKLSTLWCPHKWSCRVKVDWTTELPKPPNQAMAASSQQSWGFMMVV